jgi:hypothetical protein
MRSPVRFGAGRIGSFETICMHGGRLLESGRPFFLPQPHPAGYAACHHNVPEKEPWHRGLVQKAFPYRNGFLTIPVEPIRPAQARFAAAAPTPVSLCRQGGRRRIEDF